MWLAAAFQGEGGAGVVRQKLAVGADTPQYLHTVRGFGYRLCEPEGLPPTGVNEAEGAIDR